MRRSANAFYKLTALGDWAYLGILGWWWCAICFRQFVKAGPVAIVGPLEDVGPTGGVDPGVVAPDEAAGGRLDG